MSRFSRSRVIGGSEQHAPPSALGRFLDRLSPELDFLDLTAGAGRITLPNYQGPAPKMAFQDMSLSGRKSVPIGTDGLVCCVAMAIVCRDADEHVAAHISAGTEKKRLLALVRPYEGRDVSVFLREGAVDSGVLRNVYWVLSKTGLNAMQIVRPGADLVAHGGGVYVLGPGAGTSTDFSGCRLVSLAAPEPPIHLH